MFTRSNLSRTVVALVMITSALSLSFTTSSVGAAPPAPKIVTVAGTFEAGSTEAVVLVAELQALASANVDVQYEMYEFPGLDALLADPNPPDIVLSPVATNLIDLSENFADLGRVVRPNKLRSDYGDHLIVETGSKIVAAPVRFGIKSLVWYEPAFFAANEYAIPTSFDELVALSDQMVADGQTPWCNYIWSGPATGWVGTDWVEDLLLGAEGGTVYDQWVSHEIPFVDDRVETAFDRYVQMIDTPGYVHDRDNMLFEHFFDNVFPLVDQECAMHRQADFFGQFFGFVDANISDYDTFPMPSVDESLRGATMGNATFVAMVDDRPEVRKIVRGALSNRFGTLGLVQSDIGWLVPNARFDASHYENPLERKWFEQFTAAVENDLFRFDASDAMPPNVGGGTFWSGIVDIVSGAKTVPTVLSDIDASWPN